MSQSIPEELARLVGLNIEFQVLICLECKCAITPTAISRHLSDRHKSPIAIRKQLDAYIQEVGFKYDFTSIQLPSSGLIPQPIIPVLDGHKCKECPFVSQSRSATRKHCNKDHNKKRLPDEELFEAVKLQCWFGEKRGRFWIVDVQMQEAQVQQARRATIRDVGEAGDQEDDRSGDEDSESSGQEDVDDQIVQDIEQWMGEKQERRLRLLKEVSADEMDAWLRYTKWNVILSQSKHDFIKTFHFTRMPDPQEPELERLLRAWNGIVERCIDTLEATDHKDALKWWASPKNEAASQRPFELPQNTKSIAKYSDIWASFICYMMRTADQESHENETETGVKYTENQWKCIQRIREKLKEPGPGADEVEDPTLVGALMCLCMLTIMQDTSRIALYDSPMMHYLAVRGVDEQSQSLRSAFFYTPILAGMLWINRLIMMEIAVPMEPWPALGLESKAVVRSVPDRIHDLRQQHLCEGSFSPTSSILTQLAMGKKFNQTHQSPSNIHWSDDEETIFYLGQPVVLDKIQGMIEFSIHELQELMIELTFGSPVETVDLSRIVDSMAWSQAFRRQDFSFISHTQNQDQVKGDYQYLLGRARRGEGRWKMFKANRETKKTEWNKPQVIAYLTKERKFLQKLMVLMHITGGQPARGPELGSIKVSNSVYSARNIYIINGRVCFLTMYDKARKRRGNTEYIVRCLPDAVGQTLAQYLIRVRPFARALDKRESEYLFGDMQGPWAGEQLSQALGRTTQKHLGVQLKVSAWRHAAIGIATRKLMRASKTWEKEYEEPEEGVEDFAEGDDDEELELDTFRHIMVRQSGHGRRVAQAHYAIDGAFLHRLGPELISAYEQASTAWHGLWHLEGPPQEMTHIGIGHRREASQQLTSRPMKRERTEVADRVLVGLQRIFNNIHAKPQSEGQASALQLVHYASKKRPLVVVLPTSSGKSALFFSVAAMTDQQTVVVVVPFAALVDDILIRGQAAGLHCEEWIDERSGRELQQLIVVSADRAVQGTFLHYMKVLEIEGQLAHVFFDEVHVALTDTSYRERLRELWKLRYLECPFTGLTATLMVELEGLLKERMCIDNVEIFRRNTARKSIRYQVRDSKDHVPSEVAIQHVQNIQLQPKQRGIIYVRSYNIGGVISSKLKCPFYRAKADDKGEVLQQWIAGGGGWIVATGALGTGINIEGIIHVVHVGRPYGLTSFVQQSGRGGRSGEVSESMIITRVEHSSGQRRSEIMSEYSVEQVDEDAMTEFIQSKRCRRQVLGRYMDGSAGDSCHESDSMFCDRCRASSRAPTATAVGSQPEVEVPVKEHTSQEGPSGLAMIETRLRKVEASHEQMIRVIEYLQGGCVFCRLSRGGEGDAAPHDYFDCTLAAASGCGKERYQAWREKVDFGKSKHCWECGLSQQICRRLEDGRPCEYPDVMLPGIFILHAEEHLQSIVEVVGFQGENEKDMWEWMRGVKEGFGTEWESNWMGAWRAICQVYEQMHEDIKADSK